jgi:hypothetical protein
LWHRLDARVHLDSDVLFQVSSDSVLDRPELNSTESLWGQGKNGTSANKQYANIDEQIEPFITVTI